MRRSANQRGFTLAEAVIAVTILGLMGTLVAGTFGRALDGRERAEAISTHYHEVRQAMLRMSRELEMAYLSFHVNCEEPHYKTIFRTEGASGGQRIDFTSFSHYKISADANESDQNELSYYVGRHPDPPKDWDSSRTVLIRREDPRPDDEPDRGGVEQVLAEDVTHLSFSFYNDKEDRWEDDWDADDLDFKGRLPMFVAIDMKVLGLDGKEEEFHTKTRIFLRKPLAQPGYGQPCE